MNQVHPLLLSKMKIKEIKFAYYKSIGTKRAQ